MTQETGIATVLGLEFRLPARGTIRNPHAAEKYLAPAGNAICVRTEEEDEA
jgi:hypothetical protein